MVKLPSINDVNMFRLRSWVYDRLTEQFVYDDELADALGVPYDTSMNEPGEDATEEEWIEYDNFYDEQNDNLWDLYYAAIINFYDAVRIHGQVTGLICNN